MTVDLSRYDVFCNEHGDMQLLINGMMTDAFDHQRKSRLACMSETPLDAPVFVEIDRSMIHDSSRRTPLDEFMADIQAKVAKAKGHPVFVRYEEESGYEGEHWTYFEIGYERPPTKKEIAERRRLNAEIAEAKAEAEDDRKAKEEAEYLRLKAKFEAERA